MIAPGPVPGAISQFWVSASSTEEHRIPVLIKLEVLPLGHECEHATGPGPARPRLPDRGTRVTTPEVSVAATRVERTMSAVSDSPSESRPKSRLAVDPETLLEGLNPQQR